jgi:thioredoxin reductase/NAD-dependent dihydropyrimidine dehydrogenase PreA subunit
MSDTLIIWGVGLALTLVVGLPFVLHARRRERTTDEWEARALELGLNEPVTLHPLIDPTRCIGTGSCVAICPEVDVIGFRDGQALAVSPARCIGHGLCERSCPMEAIQLVFGTAKRGIELPRVKGDFETNVPGLYIVGELGGMGLIRNAFEQGRQCVEGMLRRPDWRGSEPYDVVIVGCGPAGLSASLTCLHHGLRFITLEREDIGGTVRHYPRRKVVMTEQMKVPGYGNIGARQISKEELVAIWEDVVSKTGLQVSTGETVENVRAMGAEENGAGSGKAARAGAFEVQSDRGTYRSARVVLGIGRRGVPRKLGIPGEELSNVSYTLREPEAYQDSRITVVGGGDAAVEAALALAEQPGNRIQIAYRKDRFSRVKECNRARIGEAQRAGEIDILWSTEVVRNQMGGVTLRDGSDAVRSVDNDQLFVFVGGELPTPFLERCGVKVDTKFGEP